MQKKSKRIEELFAQAETVGGMAQTCYRGGERVRSGFMLTMTAANVARLSGLLAASRSRLPAGAQGVSLIATGHSLHGKEPRENVAASRLFQHPALTITVKALFHDVLSGATGRENVWMRKAGDGTETTVEQALMRGSATA